jgi:hypothetical protein
MMIKKSSIRWIAPSQWFFIPLGFRYRAAGLNDDTAGHYSHMGSVFGPYGSSEEVDRTITKLWPSDDGKDDYLVFRGQIRKRKPAPKQLPPEERRKAGDPANYIKQEQGGYRCRTCGDPVMGATIYHPIWIRGMAGGSGEVKTETVPWCPNCEIKPDS